MGAQNLVTLLEALDSSDNPSKSSLQNHKGGRRHMINLVSFEVNNLLQRLLVKHRHLNFFFSISNISLP